MTKTTITKEKPSEELQVLRQRVAELEALELEHQTDKKLVQLEGEERYQTVFESANDVILLIDKKGKIIDVNKRITEIGGYEREEFIGKNISSLARIMTKKSLATILGNFLKRMAGVNVHIYEVEMFKKNGELITFEISARPLRKDGKTIGDLAILRDITERKQAEEKYSTIIGTATDGFMITDLEGNFIDVNESYCQMIGYSREDLLKMSVSDVEAIKNPKKVIEDITNIAKLGQQRFETKHRCKDGKIIDIEVSAKYHDVEKGQLVVFIRDISERKQTQEALKASEENFRNSLDNSSMGIRIIDVDGHTFYANHAFLDMVGYDTIDEYAAIPTQKRYTPEEYALYLQRVKRRKHGQLEENKFEVNIVRKDGLTRWLQCYNKEMSWDGKNRYQLTYEDITERKQAEQALRESQERFIETADLLPLSIFEINMEGKYTYLNKEALRAWNSTKPTIKDALADNPLNTFIQEDRERIAKNITSILRGEDIVPQEYTALRDDGTTFPVVIYATPIMRENKIIGIRGVAVDITERKRTEEALKASEEKFHSAMDNSPLGTILHNTENEILYANQAMLDIYGYASVDELKGVPLKERYTPETYAKFLRGDRRIRGEENQNNYEVDIIRKDGAIRNLQVFRKHVYLGGTRQYQLLHTDITEQRHAEKALEESEQKYSTLVEKGNDGIIVIRDGLLAFANPKSLEMIGFKANEVLGKPFESFIPPGFRDLLRERYQKRIAGEKIPSSYEAAIVDKGGRVIPVEINANTIEYAGKQSDLAIVRDITERKQAQQALKVSEEKFRNSLDNSPLGIRIADIDGHSLYANQAFLDIYGYENLDEYRATPPQKRLTPEGYAKYVFEAEKRKRSEKIEGKLETSIVRKDGSIRWLQVSSKEMFWDGKKQYQSIYEDITERKQAEQLYQTLANNSSVGVYMVQNRNFVFTNPAFQSITGFTADELLGTNPANLVHPEDWENVRQNAVQMLKGERTQPYELRLITKSGEIRWGLERLSTITYQGKPATLGNYMDISERKLAEQALRRNKDSLNEAQKLAHIGSFEIDMKTGKNDWSEELFNIFGIDPGKTMPTIKSFLSSVHPDDRKRVAKSMEITASQHQVPNIEYRVVTPDGRERDILSQVKATYDDRGQPLTTFGTSMDITERKQTQDEISRSYRIQAAINVILKVALEEVSLEEILKRSMDLVLSIPWLTFESRGNIFLVEDDPRVLVMKAQNGLAQPIQRECARVPFVRCICGQAALTREIQFVDCINERHETSYDGIIPHGHYCVPILSADKVLGVINIYVKEGHRRDKREEEFLSTVADALAGIIERKRAQDRIERAAEEWRTTFDSITDFISIHDKDNRIVRVNKAMADTLKTTPKELIGKFCHEVMHGTKEPPANCPHWQTLKTGKSATMETFNSNLGIHLQESTSPLFNEQGEVTGSVIVARDVTKEKRMEEQLIMTDRMASIGELASGVAHELNNPLTSVIGFSQLLMEGDVPDNIKEDLATVYSEAQRAAVIVKNLLTFARKHTPVKQLSQVNTIVEDVLRLRAYEQKVNNIEVDKQLATNLPEIMSDHFQLQQVFLNIIVNAEFAMKEAHGKGKLVITTEKFDGVVKVAITDDGPGITEENLKRIFDPFFTTKEVGKGTGLGLSICHGIVTEHGGKIYARSEKDKGATFVVELPLN